MMVSPLGFSRSRGVTRCTCSPRVRSFHSFERLHMALLEIPPPYDFVVSTERYRAFGPDLANLWHDDGLHRVVFGREVRITAADGGVDVEPLDSETEPVVRHLLGLPFDLDSFY